ncbi:cobalamin B12-binding domain-containing protein [Pseudobacteroides cellulosolvens]|uniref:Cobalamin B12-binding domain protein n=1 Tax=Pseudobacteroides cellulosolvens ATCC 35603 = DSM 2933 TaxID=398512 RepID=A0A0L6JP17_9FIRM|nr:cobalamin-dependent protein [Pseudobacteroides cellulosolvens]KNY27529.1 cobalamin B12-binding domain protein [Pseudobacteroides cellulosolvens ATCC 35603 = DSM 2933]
MNKFYEEFLKHLENEERYACLDYAVSKLSTGELDVVTLYEEIVGPALNSIECNLEDKSLCIWREHVRSSIVRTVIENCYTYVIKEQAEKRIREAAGIAVVICPDGEYHEIGARIVADFFTICGFDTTFVGSSTPKEEFINILEYLKPDFIAVSVTNYYNLVSAHKTIKDIRTRYKGNLKILAGGNAFSKNPNAYKEMGADKYVRTFDEIRDYIGGGR